MNTVIKYLPRTATVAAVLVALAMFGSAVYELRQSRIELFHMLEEHSLSLATTIERSSANIVVATERLEQQISERLLNNANFVARLDSTRTLSPQELQTIAALNNIFRINIFDRNGNRAIGSHQPMHSTNGVNQNRSPRDELAPIFSGKEQSMIIGLKNARFENGQRYAVAVRRTKAGGGAIVVNLDAAELVQFRRQIGIGKLIKDLGTTNDVEYVVLQDREGIVAASGGVEEMSSIVSDSVLTVGLERDTILTRIAQFRGHDVYEVVRRLNIDGSPVGILRIAMSMNEIRANDARMSRRFIVMTLVLLTMGVLLISAILFGKRYRRTFQRYAAIRTTTDMILENMQDAVITLDDSDRIVFFNRQAEQMFGMTVASVVGRIVSELEVPAAACFKSIFTQSREDTIIECAEGRSRSVSISLSTVVNDAGVLEHRTAVIKDLTEIKRVESERKRQEKLAAMGELAAGVAHEIRNPLNAIGMIIQRLEREFIPRNGAKEYRSLAGVLKKETARVNNIIQHFLKFARPPKLNLSAVDPKQFAAHIVHLFDSQARSKKIAFSSHCNHTGQLHIDQEQMTQALLNLLQNAQEATPAGGTITLSIDLDDEEILFTISDSGTGISTEQIEKIFDLYFTTRANGTGMGLAITQQIVSRHGGVIHVTSPLQHGSVFTIHIPIQPSAADADLAS